MGLDWTKQLQQKNGRGARLVGELKNRKDRYTRAVEIEREDGTWTYDLYTEDGVYYAGDFISFNLENTPECECSETGAITMSVSFGLPTLPASECKPGRYLRLTTDTVHTLTEEGWSGDVSDDEPMFGPLPEKVRPPVRHGLATSKDGKTAECIEWHGQVIIRRGCMSPWVFSSEEPAARAGWTIEWEQC